MTDKKGIIRYAFRASLPVMAGYLFLGIGFGILLQSKGVSWWWAPIMGLSIFSGTMQYVMVDLIAGGVTFAYSAIMTLLVNFRYMFYSVAMLEKYRKVGSAKPYLIFSLTDETFSIVSSPILPKEMQTPLFYFLLSAFDQSYWIVGCTVGSLIGSAFAFNSTGIDFSMTALFVVVFVEQWEKAKSHLPALTGVIASLACLIIFGSDKFLIPAMILITLSLFAEKKWIKEGDGND